MLRTAAFEMHTRIRISKLVNYRTKKLCQRGQQQTEQLEYFTHAQKASNQQT